MFFKKYLQRVKKTLENHRFLNPNAKFTKAISSRTSTNDTSKTNDEYLVKLPGQSQIVAYKKNQVKSATKMETSLMPAFPLKETEYLDLIGYLEGLK